MQTQLLPSTGKKAFVDADSTSLISYYDKFQTKSNCLDPTEQE